MTGSSADARCKLTVSPQVLLLVAIPIQFFCFYWWAARTYYFTGDGLYYFSRQIHSLSEFAARFFSVDDLYQYRPLTYVVFSFILHPLFGNHPFPYHLTAYLFSTVNVLLGCTCIYYWTGEKKELSFYAAIFLVLNPIHFFPSFGPTYIDQWLSSFFYFATLLVILRQSSSAQVLAPITFLLALLSKEHSVMLPFHAILVLLAIDFPFRDALRKTRNLWIVLAAFVTFQLLIRHGAVFAPAGSNPDMQFSVSAGRIVELIKGAKPAFFYPENYLMDGMFGIGRWIRLSTLIPILGAIVLGMKRRPKLAMSGMVWFAVSLLPVAFLSEPPSPRHYYLGLPGLVIVLASAVTSWRAMAIVMPLIALLTITDVHLYAQRSWIAIGAHHTKGYLRHISAMLGETGRSSFYVMNGGDPHFFWHVDGGAAVEHILGRHATFRFAALKEPLDTDEWLNNHVNVILPYEGNITDGVRTGEFPPATDRNVCSIVREITGTESGCSIMFRGRPVLGSGSLVETPNKLPVFEVPEGMVTLSRTTIRIAVDGGFQLKHTVRVVPESVDGVVVEVYQQRETTFTRAFSQALAPGERRELAYFIPPGEVRHVLIRIRPGPNQDELGDWLVWER